MYNPQSMFIKYTYIFTCRPTCPAVFWEMSETWLEQSSEALLLCLPINAALWRDAVPWMRSIPHACWCKCMEKGRTHWTLSFYLMNASRQTLSGELLSAIEFQRCMVPTCMVRCPAGTSQLVSTRDYIYFIARVTVDLRSPPYPWNLLYAGDVVLT